MTILGDIVSRFLAAGRPVDVAAAGRAALAEAERLWREDVVDVSPRDESPNAVRCRAIIQEMCAAAGLTHHVYRGNGQGAEWCLIFWLRCWSARLNLTPEERATYLISTYRAMELWAGRSIFGVPCPVRPGRRAWTFDAHTSALPAGCVPQAGDLLIVGDGQPGWGDHATLVSSYDRKARVFSTVEGNAGAVGPRGDRRQGIGKATRPLGKRAGQTYYALALYRPAPGDLVTG